MNGDLFRRYVWLVDVISHAKKIQYEDIAELWSKSELNDDNSVLALRTFHNHRHAINNLFGIKILCDRGDRNHYYIHIGDDAEKTNLKIWMMQKLGYSDIETSLSQLSDRIILDSLPEDKFGLNVLIKGLEENRMVKLTYSIPIADNMTTMVMAPYCMRYWRSGWYLLAEAVETKRICLLDLDRVVEVVLTDKPFIYPENFSPRDFFKNLFGMKLHGEQTPETVRLRIFGSQRDKIRTLPLHCSQKELIAASDYSVFEYFIIPGEDFFNAVISLGLDCQVIYPDLLRKEFVKRLKKLVDSYEEIDNNSLNSDNYLIIDNRR